MGIFKEPKNTNATTLSIALSAIAGAVVGAMVFVLWFFQPGDTAFEMCFWMAWTSLIGSLFGAKLNMEVQWTRPKESTIDGTKEQ